MAKKKGSTAVRLRTPAEMADAAIKRFVDATANGAGVDSDAWKKAIETEAQVFAGEILQGVAKVAGKKQGKVITDALSEATSA